MKLILVFVILMAIQVGSFIYAQTDIVSSHKDQYQEFKNSNLIPEELKNVLPNNILGDPKYYKSEVLYENGYQWVSVRFHSPDDGEHKIDNEFERNLKSNHAYLWNGLAREIILSNRSRVMFWGLEDQFIEFYSAYPIE